MQHFYFSLQCLVLNKKQDLHPLQPYQTYQMIPYYTDVPILKTHIIYIFCVQPIACCHLTLFCKLAAAQCSPHYVTCQNKHKCTYFVQTIPLLLHSSSQIVAFPPTTSVLLLLPQACGHRWKNVFYSRKENQNKLPHGVCYRYEADLKQSQPLIPCYKGTLFCIYRISDSYSLMHTVAKRFATEKWKCGL